MTNDDQLDYGMHGPDRCSLSGVGGGNGVSQDYKDRLAAEGVEATWMDFHNLTVRPHGAAHCTTQVLRRQP